MERRLSELESGAPKTVLVCSLDPRERRRTRKALAANLRDAAVVCEQELTVSELKGIKLRGPKTDLALLVHFSEGRVLLTDKVGSSALCKLSIMCSQWTTRNSNVKWPYVTSRALLGRDAAGHFSAETP